MIVAVWAALAMVLQDILAVLMVQCENRKRGWAAGCLDAASYLCALVTNHFALNALNGHNRTLEIVVVLLVTAANVIGSKTGTMLGDKLFPDQAEERMEAIERQLAELLATGNKGISVAPSCCQSPGCTCR